MHARLAHVTQAARIELRYTLRVPDGEWHCPEGGVPESVGHDLASRHLHALLAFWAARSTRNLFVAHNLAVRWVEARPRVGIDPDVCLLDPPPPDVASLRSLCLWKPAHVAPSVSFEIVSKRHPYKDYVTIHERYAALGARELFVLDPELLGPKSLGGPVPIQVWRSDGAIYERTYVGQGPAFSEVLGAWVFLEGGLPQIATDYAGRERWLTEQEFERTEKERERAEKERERAEKERERAEKERERAARLSVERRLAELEARIAMKK